MDQSLKKIVSGYNTFRKKYAESDQALMQNLSIHGQKPKIMVIACCDSRVDPALILQCDPGDLFVVRNVANIVPPYEKDEKHHGTSAALEFAVCYLNVKRIIILGHSQCGGIKSLVNQEEALSGQDDFISNWVSVVKTSGCEKYANNSDDYAKVALQQSYQNSLTFPWIAKKIAANELAIHRWFFDIKSGQIFTYCEEHKAYNPLT